MSVAPIVTSVAIKAAPQRAFELFTQEMGRWWPKGIGKAPFVEIMLEPYKGGRWYERDAEGVETQWGAVLAWEPPRRLLLAWQINSRWSFDAEFMTEVEVTFSPADGGTHVANTREIGGIKVVGTRSKGKSNKRLEIVLTGGEGDEQFAN